MDIRAQMKLDEDACKVVGIEPRTEYWVSRDQGQSYTYIAQQRHEAEHFLEVEYPTLKAQGYALHEETIFPPVSSDIAAAWKVVEALRQHGWIVRVQEMPDGLPFLLGSGWRGEEGQCDQRACCILHPNPALEKKQGHRFGLPAPTAFGESAPEAICRAALEARRIEEVEHDRAGVAEG